MTRFILVDHSLIDIGGHHFRYAVQYLSAAEALGLAPVLATHRHFAPPLEVPSTWQVLPVFHNTGYARYRLGIDGTSRHPIDLSGHFLLDRDGDTLAARSLSVCRNALIRMRDLRWLFGRRRRLMQFAQDLAAVWQQVRPNSRDYLFLPTITDYDLVGLVRFLQSEPSTRHVCWQVQFHSDLFFGRPPTYSSQSRRERSLRRHFENLLRHIPNHHLVFYGTTQRICYQYERVLNRPVKTLNEPVDLTLADAIQRVPRAPLRLVSAGELRQEKGLADIGNLLATVARGGLFEGKLRVILQTKNAQWQQGIPNSMVLKSNTSTDRPCPVIALRHPLSSKAYRELICRSDIGLLIYDREGYFARASGVCVELLAAGVPIIVPAGTWAAQQIMPAISGHLASLAANQDSLVLGADRCQKRAAQTGTAQPERSANDEWHITEQLPVISRPIAVRSTATHVLVSVPWPEHNQAGVFLRVRCAIDSPSGPVRNDGAILEPCSGHTARMCLFPLPVGAQQITLQFSVAFDPTELWLGVPTVYQLDARATATGDIPAGAVGRTFAAAADLPPIIQEMVAHYDHYRATAVAFSHAWRQRFAPRSTIETVVAARQQAPLDPSRNAGVAS